MDFRASAVRKCLAGCEITLMCALSTGRREDKYRKGNVSFIFTSCLLNGGRSEV
jgi:hypothetical protein